jgi:hypothetical protein
VVGAPYILNPWRWVAGGGWRVAGVSKFHPTHAISIVAVLSRYYSKASDL